MYQTWGDPADAGREKPQFNFVWGDALQGPHSNRTGLDTLYFVQSPIPFSSTSYCQYRITGIREDDQGILYKSSQCCNSKDNFTELELRSESRLSTRVLKTQRKSPWEFTVAQLRLHCCGSMALLDFSMQDEKHARPQASRAKELTNGVTNLHIPYQTEVGIAHHGKSSNLWGVAEATQSEVASDKEQMVPLSTYQDARSIGMSNSWAPLVTTQHSTPRANRHIIDLVPSCQKIFKCPKTGTWKLLSLGGGAKQELYLTDGSTDLNLSSSPKKGCLFGKSRTSDFVRRNPGNTLLTKVLNYYFELNFCWQWIYQRQFRICDNCHLNKLPIVSTLWNCFSESPWKGSGRQVEYQTPLTPPFNATVRTSTRYWTQEGIINCKTPDSGQLVMYLFYTKVSAIIV